MIVSEYFKSFTQPMISPLTSTSESTLLTSNATSTSNAVTYAQVTIVVVPRERFSCTETSLQSIYEHTRIPFELVYVDGNLPPHVQSYLETQAQKHQFKLICTEHYLFPNLSRNIGLARVKTPYLVFLDNDVIVSSGWLEALLNCAEEADAAVVDPLMCHKEPIHEEVHFVGGKSHVWIDKLGCLCSRAKAGCIKGVGLGFQSASFSQHLASW